MIPLCLRQSIIEHRQYAPNDLSTLFDYHLL